MLDKNSIPKHIAIIMDGNGRWAKQRLLPRSVGHQMGIKRVREIVKGAFELGVKILTLFAFSTENWQRPRREVDILMKNFSNFLDKEITELNRNNIRLRVIGRDKPLPQELIIKIKQAERLTVGNNGLTVVLAVNYGGRAEIVDAATKLSRAIQAGAYSLSQVSEEIFSGFLYAPDLPEPDLLIRTSGESRLSNFLLWEMAYTELYFVHKYWPDFTKRDLIKAISEYQKRKRRFGRI
ncbi:MAG: isoprenyl transferase [Candidatus Omnitrophota bacterium]|jgi:undecaprenyl diphosphate synthase